MQSISPEIIFRGNDAWERAVPQISKFIQSPLILGRSIHTHNLRNKLFKDFNTAFADLRLMERSLE